MIAEKGAAIVSRVTFKGRYCRGSMTLNPIVNGRVDQNNSVSITQETGKPGMSALRDQVKRNGYTEIFNPQGFKEYQKYLLSQTRYTSIKPGKYVVTSLECWEGGASWHMGVTDDILLEAIFGANLQKPIKGDNSITIDRGQVIDTGTLDIVPDFWGAPTAKLVGREASAEIREVSRQSAPDLYEHISYERFSPL
jgi:hypothetical protein